MEYFDTTKNIKRKSNRIDKLEKQNIARRKQYAELKQDPELYELVKQKERRRYQERKNKGQFRSIKDLPPRERRERLKKWREAAKKYRERKKEEARNKPIVPEMMILKTNNDNDFEDPLLNPKPKTGSLKIKRGRKKKETKNNPNAFEIMNADTYIKNKDEIGSEHTLDSPKDLEKIVNQEKNRSFVEEIKTILAYTNAVPFKTKGGKFFCTYCSIDGFDDPDELRLHSEFHEDVWLKNVEHILRPHFQNEILRLDMENLRCKHCDSRIKTWNDMFQHLRELHQMELDQAYTRLVPFKLRREFMNCALCDEHFINFTYLDNHMNSHYCNYMCSECGDTFLAENRLKHHIQIHNTGKFKCHVCGKVFSLEKYMRKHQAMVHRMNKIFKCTYCPERFHVEYERHTHIVEKHKEKVRIYTCELCGKSFDWRPYYLAHLRKAHSKVKKHKCRFCTKAFVSKHEVKLHEQRHTGDGKHVCTKCNNNYVTLAELRLHLKKHFKEVGYSPLKIET